MENLTNWQSWRKFAYKMLREIARGDIIKIDYVQGTIEEGLISREEAVNFIKKGLEKFVRERDITRKIERVIDWLEKILPYKKLCKFLNYRIRPLLPYYGFPEEQYQQAREALKAIKEGKSIYFRGHTI